MHAIYIAGNLLDCLPCCQHFSKVLVELMYWYTSVEVLLFLLVSPVLVYIAVDLDCLPVDLHFSRTVYPMHSLVLILVSVELMYWYTSVEVLLYHSLVMRSVC